ncbi:hypothetical protein [Mycolicibacterium holsaticum]|uniref:hypothetical protein n=1 Tax=Mycolicibacterium holsaticum TaxID=152142 RepID=UPI001C7E05DB|nr:hypothetical protein [Mycolicibacterium holsaticum]QZA13077.1 hypothetical protein K3U96_02460 [Mycolicibacterium holsaticum DSM 44478 = JCM 12374]
MIEHPDARRGRIPARDRQMLTAAYLPVIGLVVATFAVHFWARGRQPQGTRR